MIPVLLAKLDKETSDFIASLVTKGEYKSKLVALALAKAVSIGMQLPPEPVEDAGLHFSMVHKQKVITAAIAVNELITIDIDEVIELAKKFFIYKYNVMFYDFQVPYVNKDTAVEDFFGISRVFGKDVTDIITEHNSKLTMYVNRFISVIERLGSR